LAEDRAAWKTLFCKDTRHKNISPKPQSKTFPFTSNNWEKLAEDQAAWKTILRKDADFSIDPKN